jgi:polyisoprenoid-binding protein YceI
MMKNKFVQSAVALCCFVMLSSFAVLTLRPVDSNNAVTFVIQNFGIDTKGEFKGLKGNIQWNEENPAASAINVSVNANTINTNIDSRDKELKDEAYFSTDKYPLISFVSTGITPNNGSYKATGNLTLKGVTKTISFPFTATKTANGYLFSGNFTINRLDYGVGKSSMVLSDDVAITLKVQGMQ